MFWYFSHVKLKDLKYFSQPTGTKKKHRAQLETSNKKGSGRMEKVWEQRQRRLIMVVQEEYTNSTVGRGKKRKRY